MALGKRSLPRSAILLRNFHVKNDATMQGKPGFRVFSSISMIWLIASILILFELENMWGDPWLRSKARRVPSLVPEPMGSAWFLALLLVGLACVFLIVAEILVAKDPGIPRQKKLGTGVATLLALVLSVQWVLVTSGASSGAMFRHAGKTHVVTLTWDASSSVVKGYNVYRGTHSGGPYTKVNSHLVPGLSYQDQDVPGGTTYYYVTRAVDGNGRESANSSEIKVVVP